MDVRKYIADNTIGHVGNDTWKRLSRKQREAIKKDRANAAKLVKEFIDDKNRNLGLRKKDLTKPNS